MKQIEQFIESIFPSQTAQNKEMKPSLSPEEEAKKKQEAEDAKWDLIYMGIAVMCTLTVVSLMMVSFKFSRSTHHLFTQLHHSLTPVLQLLVAWFAGARFDIAYHQLKQGLFKAPAPGSEEAQQVIEKFDHGEL